MTFSNMCQDPDSQLYWPLKPLLGNWDIKHNAETGYIFLVVNLGIWDKKNKTVKPCLSPSLKKTTDLTL